MQPIESTNVRLEPLVAAHADEMFQPMSAAAIYDYIPGEPPSSPSALWQRYIQLEKGRSADGRERWVNWVVRLSSGQCTGYVQATIYPERTANFAFVFAPAYWGRGVAFEACQAVLAHLARDFRVTALFATVDPRNVRSIRLLTRLGFNEISPAGHPHAAVEATDRVFSMRLWGHMAIRTAITKLLGISHPILLAPMDQVADGRLTAAVSATGGLGILGGGYGEEQWLIRELDVLERSAERFGVGFITWSMAKQPKLLDLALERKPIAVMLSFGDPAPFVDRIKRTGAILICQIQSLTAAVQAAACGADILVPQGTEAGGHGVSRGLISLVPEVVDAIGTKLPVVATGGIADGRRFAAALMLGASGVLMGTRFYATQEAAGVQAAKERIRAATGDDTLRSIVFDISRRNVWPAPFTGRCLRNAHLERWYGHEVELLRHLDEESTKYAAARSDGNFDVAAVIAGERLEAGSCVYQPPAIRHRELTHSDDLECSRSLCLPQMEVP